MDLLEARGLTYRHPQSGRGIDAVDLRLPRGTLTVVTGRVGAGKTTLLRALLGLLPAEAGEIRWNGHLVDDAASFLVPPRAAYTAQVPRLFSETLKQNILLGLPDDPAALAAALRGAVLERDVQALEAGLETPVGTRGVKLSGGQVQRTAAARMLVRGAELLVIDDLSSALDVETERVLWERLFSRRRRDVPGRLAPPRRAAPRRPHRRVEGGPHRSPGHACLLAGELRGDAVPVARRRRSRCPLDGSGKGERLQPKRACPTYNNWRMGAGRVDCKHQHIHLGTPTSGSGRTT